jgi:predicted MPP superfamily phosphohydrolase
MKRDSVEWKTNFEELIKLEKQVGFDLLLNESRVISNGLNNFNIVGVENWGAGNFNKDGDLDAAMNIVDDNLPTILLSHDPSHWKEVVLKSDYDIDLQLSGHTHGMQFGIEIPGFKWSPVKYRYKEWAGLYENVGKQIYVNRGLGHLGYAGRVGIMPDISVLNIMSKI